MTLSDIEKALLAGLAGGIILGVALDASLAPRTITINAVPPAAAASFPPSFSPPAPPPVNHAGKGTGWDGPCIPEPTWEALPEMRSPLPIPQPQAAAPPEPSDPLRSGVPPGPLEGNVSIDQRSVEHGPASGNSNAAVMAMIAKLIEAIQTNKQAAGSSASTPKAQGEP